LVAISFPLGYIRLKFKGILMFSWLFGKGKGAEKVTPLEAPDSRGLEVVVEADPDTGWNHWDTAKAEQDSRPIQRTQPKPVARPVPMEEPERSPLAGSSSDEDVAFPVITPTALDVDLSTRPMPLDRRSPEHQKNDALAIIELHHERIAKSIRSMWGYKECGVYINKLIMSGGDGMGHSRIGFNQDAEEAMLALADLHDAQFGPADVLGGAGFADPTIRAGIEGSR
jgi:hypothetical protein